MRRHQATRALLALIFGVVVAGLWPAISTPPASAHTLLRGFAGALSVADPVETQDQRLAELSQKTGNNI